MKSSISRNDAHKVQKGGTYHDGTYHRSSAFGTSCGTNMIVVSLDMPAIHVRNLSEEVIDALKRRAARHRRSLQNELAFILESIARQEPDGGELPPIKLHLSKATKGSWRREEIYGDDGR